MTTKQLNKLNKSLLSFFSTTERMKWYAIGKVFIEVRGYGSFVNLAFCRYLINWTALKRNVFPKVRERSGFSTSSFEVFWPKYCCAIYAELLLTKYGIMH